MKKYPNIIPLVLNAINIEQEDLIQTIFDTFTEFFENPSLMRNHLQILVDAACNISENTDLNLNVRSATLLFLERVGEVYTKKLVKKHGDLITKIINTGFKVCCEDEDGYNDDEENPHELALSLLFIFAAEPPSELVYDMFKSNIVLACQNQEDPLIRKAGLKILGFICDSDALLDPIKDDIDEFTQLMLTGLTDSNQKVREAACETIGDFSENALDTFIDQREKIMPVLLKVLEEYLTIAKTSEDEARAASRAMTALSEFIANMEDYDVQPYLSSSLEICMAYINDKDQLYLVKYEVLRALGSIIVAADETILPNRDNLLQAFFEILKSTEGGHDQALKGRALQNAGFLAQSCGTGNFPVDMLEEFTKFGLDCLQQNDSKYELKETAMNYFGEISKILRSKMEPLIPAIIDVAIASMESQEHGFIVDDYQPGQFDLDSEESDEMVNVTGGLNS